MTSPTTRPRPTSMVTTIDDLISEEGVMNGTNGRQVDDSGL